MKIKKRLSIRKKVKEGNLGLNKTAINSGVKNLAEFHNAGYKGLYNGETAADKLKRERVDNEYKANSVHFEIGRKVRKAIKDMGGTMPEDYSTPNKSIKRINKE